MIDLNLSSYNFKRFQNSLFRTTVFECLWNNINPIDAIFLKETNFLSNNEKKWQDGFQGQRHLSRHKNNSSAGFYRTKKNKPDK